MQLIAADVLVGSVDHVGVLCRQTLGEIARIVSCRELVPGEFLFSQGDKATDVFVVETGIVEIFLRTANNSYRWLDQRGPGDTIGETAIWDDSERRSSARASAFCVVLALGIRELAELINDFPAFVEGELQLM
jgi:CRP-like cAMP-binding protein